VHDDLVGRDFTAEAPNQLWLSDITKHHTGEGKLYVSAIKDVFSNRIVGYSIDSRMKSGLATQALNSAVGRRAELAAKARALSGVVICNDGKSGWDP
jgi:putative transposase